MILSLSRALYLMLLGGLFRFPSQLGFWINSKDFVCVSVIGKRNVSLMLSLIAVWKTEFANISCILSHLC